jgi:hypothetical protein
LWTVARRRRSRGRWPSHLCPQAPTAGGGCAGPGWGEGPDCPPVPAAGPQAIRRLVHRSRTLAAQPP